MKLFIALMILSGSAFAQEKFTETRLYNTWSPEDQMREEVVYEIKDGKRKQTASRIYRDKTNELRELYAEGRSWGTKDPDIDRVKAVVNSEFSVAKKPEKPIWFQKDEFASEFDHKPTSAESLDHCDLNDNRTLISCPWGQFKKVDSVVDDMRNNLKENVEKSSDIKSESSSSSER